MKSPNEPWAIETWKEKSPFTIIHQHWGRRACAAKRRHLADILVRISWGYQGCTSKPKSAPPEPDGPDGKKPRGISLQFFLSNLAVLLHDGVCVFVPRLGIIGSLRVFTMPCLWPESASPLQSQPYVKHARHNNKVSRAPDHRGPLQRQGRHGCSYESSRLNVKMEWISELQERLQ